MPKHSGDNGDKPRVLILCPEAPWPMHGGGAIRTASLIEYFAGFAAVDLVVFREPGQQEPAPIPAAINHIAYIDLPAHPRDLLSRTLRNGRRWLQQRPPLVDRFSGFEEQLRGLIADRHYSCAVVEHFWCAGYVDVIRSASDEVWLDLHNIESEWHETVSRCAPAALRPMLKTFAAACRRLEQALLPRFDVVLVPSEGDAQTAQNITSRLHLLIYPNAIPFIAPPARSEEDAIVFSGNLEYQPNIQAVQFFRRRIWPLLRERHSQLHWRIIGRNPRGVARLVHGDDRIELIGPMDEAVSGIARAKASVVPILTGSGTRLKILEAWAAGTPVVSTSFGAAGLDAVPGRDLLIADHPAAFANAVSGLLASAEQRRCISAAGRVLYETKYIWEAAWRVPASYSSAMISRFQDLYTG